MKRITCSLMLLILGTSLMAQVAVNTDGNQPDSSAMLDIQSNSKGILIPRLSTLQQIQINDPGTGLLIFNTDSLDFFFYNGSRWLGLRDNTDTLSAWQCGLPYPYAGQSYNTTQIGSQCWMAENLNAGAMIDSAVDQTDNGVIEKYCLANQPDSCAKYGGLYNWGEIMQYSTDSAAQGICPAGWHIPTDFELMVLEGTVDSQYGVGDPVWKNYDWRGLDVAKKLKSQNGWYNNGNGTDDHDFSSLPSGLFYLYGSFGGSTRYAYLWSSTELNDVVAFRRMFDYSRDISHRYFSNKELGLPLRCIKD